MGTVKTIEVVGPAGRVVIAESDLPAWKRRGYKLKEQQLPENDSNDGENEPNEDQDPNIETELDESEVMFGEDHED